MNITDFINNYKPTDIDKIRFKWNGKHAEEFDDDNYDFRTKLIDCIVDNNHDASSLLLRDLLDEESKCCVEIWGSKEGMSEIGTKLLEQSKTQYVEDFMIAKYRSSDTEMGTIPYISNELAEELANYFKQKIDKTKDKDDLEFYKHCYNYFIDYDIERYK